MSWCATSCTTCNSDTELFALRTRVSHVRICFVHQVHQWLEDRHSTRRRSRPIQLPELSRPRTCTAPAKTAGPAAAIRIEVILSSLLQVAADLKTSEELVACYKEQPLATSRGVCKVRSIAGGGIK